MSLVVRRVGIAFLQFVAGASLIYLAVRLFSHDLADETGLIHLLERSSFGRDWWTVVLIGLGAALILLSLPSPWRDDRPAPLRSAVSLAPKSDVQQYRQFADASLAEAQTEHETTVRLAASVVLRPPEAITAFQPSFRSRPLPPRPLRRLVVTRVSSPADE